MPRPDSQFFSVHVMCHNSVTMSSINNLYGYLLNKEEAAKAASSMVWRYESALFVGLALLAWGLLLALLPTLLLIHALLALLGLRGLPPCIALFVTFTHDTTPVTGGR
ncbi:hypothetical protein KY084_06845 [Stakelama sp. CBK3Z-3]|uniref:Uncharacterized protein n=1 Tax=Stakelama flava TaxID=2860338 RepID=A0ABS6XK62_9SPHN|nr:hypothetical protein [Stakelama flava]MBW4330592.1 hypothetical protein [Stakelama flava]